MGKLWKYSWRIFQQATELIVRLYQAIFHLCYGLLMWMEYFCGLLLTVIDVAGIYLWIINKP